MELYHTSIKHLPAVERLRLALLILRDLTPADLAKSRQQRPPEEPVEIGLGNGAIALVEPVQASPLT